MQAVAALVGAEPEAAIDEHSAETTGMPLEGLRHVVAALGPRLVEAATSPDARPSIAVVSAGGFRTGAAKRMQSSAPQ